MTTNTKQTLTASELEILNVLWNKKKASVREVHNELAKIKEVGYTTTLKLMQIMNEKGSVTRDDSSRTHIYQPSYSREKAQKNFMPKMIEMMFGGSTKQLVLQALGNGKTNNAELLEIQQLLTELKKKTK